MIRDPVGLPPATPASRPAPPAGEATPATPGIVTPAVPMLNPRMRIDTELNLVVLEFRDDAGQVRNSLPTAREMDAYRLAALVATEPPPGGVDVTR